MKIICLLFFFVNFQVKAESIVLNGNLSPWVSFNISEKAKSFLIALETKGPTSVFVADLIDPSGKIYIKSQPKPDSRTPADLYALLASHNRVMTVTQGLGSALVPNHDDEGPIRKGKWKMRIGSQKEVKEISYFIYEKKSERPRVLSFQVFLDSENKSLGVMEAQQILNSVKDVYSRYGISLSFELKVQKNSADLPMELDSWIESMQSNKSTGPVIHLKRNQSEYGYKDLQGFAGCLPFFVPKKVNKHCAMAVSFNDQKQIDANRFIKVIAHEIGHFLGLYHLADDFYPYGVRQDTISDTNESNERFNIMHKTSDVFDEIEFTPGQVSVMKRHPSLFH